MTREQFINELAKYVQKYAPKYGIKVCSPIIAQGVLESGAGTSELAVKANNFFGLKYKPGRCPSASGIYYKVGSEQNADGSYTSSAMQWCSFKNMEDCVIGYFDFTNIARYSNLKGVTNPRTYLENIKADGYATSLKYVDNVYAVIQKYNLTKFDVKEETSMSNPIIALSAGHGLYTAGKECDPALDPNRTKEWYLNDRIVDKIEQKLKAYNCTVIRVNDTTGKVDTPLATRTTTANNKNADIYISMHHNAGIKGGTGGGTIVYYYPSGTNKEIARNLYDHIIRCTGLKGNRSTPIASTLTLHEVRKPKAKSFLIENGFMDSRTDVPIILSEAHAEKTAIGVVNFLISYFSLTKNGTVVNAPTTTTPPPATTPSSTYTHKDFVKEVQAAIGAKVDGIAGNETLSKTITVSKTKNRKHAVVKPIQKYLNSLGYDCGTADGIAGAKFDTAVKAYQKANGCVADGEITAKAGTWKKLLKLA